MTRIADDFAEIRRRMVELDAPKPAVLSVDPADILTAAPGADLNPLAFGFWGASISQVYQDALNAINSQSVTSDMASIDYLRPLEKFINGPQT